MQTGTTIIDQMDLLNEQVKMLAGEVALCTSSLKRLSEQAANDPEDIQIQVYKLQNKFADTCDGCLYVSFCVLVGANAEAEE